MCVAERRVASRCAMMTTVRPMLNSLIASKIACSFSTSSADVASSRSKIFGSRTSALAMAIRCFSPPERRPAVSRSLYPRGSREMKPWARAFFAAAWICSSVAAMPKAMFSATVAGRITGCCGTRPICERSAEASKRSILTPSIRIVCRRSDFSCAMISAAVALGRCGWYRRFSNLKTVDLPPPVGPTMPTMPPHGMVKDSPLSTGRVGAAGYAKCTSQNSMRRWKWSPAERSRSSPRAARSSSGVKEGSTSMVILRPPVTVASCPAEATSSCKVLTPRRPTSTERS
mmetsp:Transcript_7394/g.23114  ORF Transcript_7394/g.23114 Transcript_7394/m.23114 type:complete len:287 (-) Transcript_7394:352-1212(-)